MSRHEPARTDDEARLRLRTLKPGHSRWPILEAHLEPGAPVVDEEIDGRLWATPWGWPALTEGSETV